MSWFKHILSGLSVNATGVVADHLEAYIQEPKLQTQYEVVSSCLDVSAARDLQEWADKTFANWFHELTQLLEVENSLEALTNPNYTDFINRIITALEVSRAYYAQQASEDSFLNSLRTVALRKAIVCEALSAYVIQSYSDALKEYGNEIKGHTINSVEAHLYEGTQPENFKWKKKNVFVNHIIFENVSVDQETEKAKNTGRDYLPWVFTAAFGLIAWSAAARKNRQ